MEDKLNQFFSDNNFDFQEPHSGHLDRFERALNAQKRPHRTSWKWLSAAASIVLIVGFWLGSSHQKRQMDLADVSPKMEEVQTYFVSTIYQELKTLEENRSLDTEKIIENALEELEELEDVYASFVVELTQNGKQIRVISAMIKNYQQRLLVLENTLKQIEKVKKINLEKNETYL
jgi:hypothetical protein